MKFRDDLETLVQLVLRARTHLDVWWEYEGADTRPLYLDAINDHADFFRFDSHAHFVSAIMYLAQLLETKRSNLNLRRLTAEAKACGIGSAGTASATLDATRELAGRIHMLRSNVFAQRSVQLSYADVFAKAALAPDDLMQASDATLSVVNALLRGAGQSEWAFPKGASRDLASILHKLGS